MKTISSCFLYIAVMCPLTVINFFCLVFDIVAGDWKGAFILLFSLVVGIWAIRSAYKRAKVLEMLILRSTLASETYILSKIAKDLPQSDFSPKEPEKDKTDEVASDK